MELHQNFHNFDLHNSEPSDCGEDLANGAEESALYPYSFVTPPNAHPSPFCTGVDVRMHSHTSRNTSHETIRDGQPDVTALLQQQQGMLSWILNKQEEIEQKQSGFQEKLSQLEGKVQSSSASSSPNTDRAGKRKRIVNKELSVSAALI